MNCKEYNMLLLSIWILSYILNDIFFDNEDLFYIFCGVSVLIIASDKATHSK